jgi:hypothetical protein
VKSFHHAVAGSCGRVKVAQSHAPISEIRFLLLAAKIGLNVLFSMPDRTDFTYWFECCPFQNRPNCDPVLSDVQSNAGPVVDLCSSV